MDFVRDSCEAAIVATYLRNERLRMLNLTDIDRKVVQQ